ncbi:MAG TPA: hypothetical protein VL832_29655 [Puia sp.]|nr:hypothetical protein [Puia sp.]
MDNEILSELEIKAAIRSVEREAFREKFRQLDQEDTQQPPMPTPGQAPTRGRAPAIRREKIWLSSSDRMMQFFTLGEVIVSLVACFIGLYTSWNIKPGDQDPAKKTASDQQAPPALLPRAQLEPVSRGLSSAKGEQKEMTVLLPGSLGFARPGKISLTVMINTGGEVLTPSGEGYYLYDSAHRQILLQLPQGGVIDKLIATDPLLSDGVYISMRGIYYHLHVSGAREKLAPIQGKEKIEELDKIVFQNQ